MHSPPPQKKKLLHLSFCMCWVDSFPVCEKWGLVQDLPGFFTVQFSQNTWNWLGFREENNIYSQDSFLIYYFVAETCQD